jgi:hypothetical protein
MYEIVVGHLGYEYLDVDELDGKKSTSVNDLMKIIKRYINKKDNTIRAWDMVYPLYESIKWNITDKDFENLACIELITLPEFSIYIRKL